MAHCTRAVNAYARRVRAAGPNAIGFFYYSGHGAADGGDQLPDPRRREVGRDSELWDQSLRLTEITRKLKGEAGNATHFVVFDACRNTLKLKQAGTKAVVQSKGFVPVSQESGMLIAYATAEGELASDIGAGAGPYAKVLAEEIVKPGVEAVYMFRRVQVRVRAAIKQEPYLGFNALGDVYLAGVEQPKPATSNPDALMAVCVKEEVHINAVEIASCTAKALQQGQFEYSWRDAASPGGDLIKAHDVLSASSVNGELNIGYDWQNGSLRLKPVAPIARASRSARPAGTTGPAGAPGADFHGIWLTDHSFGCMRIRLTTSGEGTGSWRIRTEPLDSDVFLRLKRSAPVAAAPTTTLPAFPKPAERAVAIAPTPVRCDGVEALGRQREAVPEAEGQLQGLPRLPRDGGDPGWRVHDGFAAEGGGPP